MINHIAKFQWMYNNQVSLPLVIRTPMGGRRGYGPTHSQTLEKIYLGIPGLQVVAPVALSSSGGSSDPGDLLSRSILESVDPLLFIENKLQYLLPVQSQTELKDLILSSEPGNTNMAFPTFILSVRSAPPPTLTIAAYGYMAELVKQAMVRLAYDQELFSELVIPTQLSPFEVGSIISSARQTGALLVVEEGTLSLGWGAEVVARLAETPYAKSLTLKRLASKEMPVPSSGPLEASVLPGVDQIVQSAIQMKR
jgi:pyruvate/2-oxoglutarate/acetoin dehydrogenase E1 component